ncbi:hypothetical protein PVA17_12145 [Lysinibacillus sp. CNPSo 3705]|uniref:hypothetical protein n=1 Tax=Lysinibacillus sp. CNPSo 3705 TaxID=3028148 RepID=UPI0023641095|nr:hypothetical protein [Lysinibacillus sp. CNPSo 3705]MDD1503508.1 hypothetical protein [Lysinibacillus sp. CNPSo 3705]
MDNNKLQALIKVNNCDNAKDHLRIVEMVLQIDNKKALDTLYVLTKSVLKKSNSL